MSKDEDELTRRWAVAAHAMQSGVAVEMVHRAEPTNPKHLRVGINTAMVDHGSLVQLLIKKGVITDIEYLTAIAEGMEAERDRYERHLSALLGRPVTLG